LDIHQLYKLQIEAVFKKGIASFNAIAKPMKENLGIKELKCILVSYHTCNSFTQSKGSNSAMYDKVVITYIVHTGTCLVTKDTRKNVMP